MAYAAGCGVVGEAVLDTAHEPQAWKEASLPAPAGGDVVRGFVGSVQHCDNSPRRRESGGRSAPPAALVPHYPAALDAEAAVKAAMAMGKIEETANTAQEMEESGAASASDGTRCARPQAGTESSLGCATATGIRH